MTRLDEAARQQALLRALWRRSPDLSIEPGLTEAPDRARRGLDAYRANATAHVRRALADIFPTLRALLGEEAFDAMAVAYWRAEPPLQGNLSHAGDRMPAFIEGDAQLASEPYLADVARLDCALHHALAAADPPTPPSGLDLLGAHDPASLVLEPSAAMALVVSSWPVLRIHSAHVQDAPPDAFSAARLALANREGDVALVWRDGYRPQAASVATTDRAWWLALMARVSLAEALDRAGPAFNFQDWLLQALVKDWLAEVRLIETPTDAASTERAPGMSTRLGDRVR